MRRKRWRCSDSGIMEASHQDIKQADTMSKLTTKKTLDLIDTSHSVSEYIELELLELELELLCGTDLAAVTISSAVRWTSRTRRSPSGWPGRAAGTPLRQWRTRFTVFCGSVQGNTALGGSEWLLDIWRECGIGCRASGRCIGIFVSGQLDESNT